MDYETERRAALSFVDAIAEQSFRAFIPNPDPEVLRILNQRIMQRIAFEASREAANDEAFLRALKIDPS